MNVNMVFLPEQNRPDGSIRSDAMNEKGVAMAGLKFVGNAVYSEVQPDVENIAQFEFIPCGMLLVKKLRMILILVNTLFITIIKHSKQVLFSLMQTVLWIMSRSEKKFISV